MFSDSQTEIHPLISSNSGEDDPQIISQYAQEVLDYSCTYGSHGTISYSALNICGRPSKYPNYGDFSECFSLRHYGPFEENEVSRKDTLDSVTFHDFVVIQFEHFVLPREIKIYETYNPGSVVRILAYLWTEKRWEMLYEDFPVVVEKKSREFCPRIKKIQAPTRVLRLEFNCSMVDYYIGIDAVMLTGIKPICPITTQPSESQVIMGLIQKKLENVKFVPQVPANEAIEEFFKNDLNKFIENLRIKEPEKEIKMKRTTEKQVADIPDEVLFKIMSYLDLRSLYNCSRVCRKFNRISKDPLLYNEVNLKLYWYRVNSDLMTSLRSRCKLIRKLDLSSCGLYGTVTPDDFMNFLRANGPKLHVLRLNSVHFMTLMCFQAIAFKCHYLQELQITNHYGQHTERDFYNLTLLSRLTKIDFSRTSVDTFGIVQLMKANTSLEHLSVAYNTNLSIDQICLVLGTHNLKIKSIDFWKCHHLTTNGLLALLDCTKLEVWNFGWNLREESNITLHFKNLLIACPNIKKMVLAAVRGIAERDLVNIATYCKNLEYLDLMGIVGITSEAIHQILRECPKLKFMDLSFCESLDDVTLFKWASDYDVIIKRSEVPSDS